MKIRYAMTSDRWQRLREIFDDALAVEPNSRDDFLRLACAGDEAMREELKSLLSAHDEAGDFIGQSAAIPEAVAFAARYEVSPTGVNQEPVEDVIGDRYELVRVLGEGGFGRVYVARDRNVSGRTVALKLLLQAKAGRWFEKRYRQELDSLARIHHPGVVGILDSGESAKGVPYLVLQMVSGVSLREVLTAGPMPLHRAVGLLRQIGEALAVVHQEGILHRDLKPENIQICDAGTDQERAVLLDFGIARIEEESPGAHSTQIAGSPAYMAPEQMLGQATVASDIYAMGLIAFEMLTGRALHEQKDEDPPQISASRHLAELRPDVPQSARESIARAVALRPRDRFSDAAAFGGELARGLLETPRRRPWTPLLAVAILFVFAAAWLWRDRQLPRMELSYSLLQRNGAQSVPVSASKVFQRGEQIRLRFHAIRGGYLYVLSEGAESTVDKPQFDLLFPGGTQDSAWIPAMQTVDLPRDATHWIEFDGSKGEEKLWIVWSARGLPDLDGLVRFSRAPYDGEITDAVEARRQKQRFDGAIRTAPQFDDQRQSALLRASGEQIVAQLVLRHE